MNWKRKIKKMVTISLEPFLDYAIFPTCFYVIFIAIFLILGERNLAILLVDGLFPVFFFGISLSLAKIHRLLMKGDEE